MTPKLSRSLGIALLTASLALQPMVARAGLVTAEQLATEAQSQADRAKVQSFLERAGVKDRMQAMGVDGVFAKDRVAALSDQEVHALAQKIDALPAGGNLSQNDLILILLIAILVAIAI